MAKHEGKTPDTKAIRKGQKSFEYLCTVDDPNYVCDAECLVHITCTDTPQKAKEKLVKKIEDIFTELQIQKDAEVERFYIGKTFIQEKMKGKMDPLNPSTWTINGISISWSHLKKEDYGKSGMIVIGVITRDQVPPEERRKLTEPESSLTEEEKYTLFLKKILIEEYKKRGDQRLENMTDKPGKTDEKESDGYALYVSFGLKKNETKETKGKGSSGNESVEADLTRGLDVLDLKEKSK